MMDRVKLVLAAVLLLALCAGLVWIGHALGSSRTTVESIAPAAAQSQADGSVIPERKPVAKPGPAPHIIPKGATEERRVSATVRPKAGPKLPPEVAQSLPASCREAIENAQCPDVTVDLSLVRMGDGRRGIASSPDGQVISALDMPIEPALILAPERLWAAGFSCSIGNSCALRTAGVIVQRDIGRVRAGVEVLRQSDGKPQARAQMLFSW